MAEKNKQQSAELNLRNILTEWLESRTRRGKVSRNTVAIGIVLLDKLRGKCPLTKEETFSPGKEIKGARSGLADTLEKYGLPRKYLKEATTRQASHDGALLIERLRYGRVLSENPEMRDRQLVEAINMLVERAHKWLMQQPIKVNCDRHQSPKVWVDTILERARGKSGGRVEQHLVGAKLQQRHPHIQVPNNPGHAADLQTKRSGDFPLDFISYHVTATDGKEAIPRCKENLETGVHPILLVPRKYVPNALARADVEGIAGRVSVLSIEDFITQNIIELSTERQEDFFATLRTIIAEYNRRLEEVETDMSLRIEVQ